MKKNGDQGIGKPFDLLFTIDDFLYLCALASSWIFEKTKPIYSFRVLRSEFSV